jgi:hypothetical protein
MNETLEELLKKFRVSNSLENWQIAGQLLERSFKLSTALDFITNHYTIKKSLYPKLTKDDFEKLDNYVYKNVIYQRFYNQASLSKTEQRLAVVVPAVIVVAIIIAAICVGCF